MVELHENQALMAPNDVLFAAGATTRSRHDFEPHGTGQFTRTSQGNHDQEIDHE